MPKGLLLLLIAAGLISAQPLDSQELPFAGCDHGQSFLRTIYGGWKRFSALWHPSGIPVLAEGGGDGGGSDGGSSDGGGSDGDGGTEGVVTGPAMVQAMPHRRMTPQPQQPLAWLMMRLPRTMRKRPMMRIPTRIRLV
jgi:hypothetical protein